ncbi:MAG: prepilin-type N-terminal cleavage/methylation domain-containing protein [Kiritimatiellaeota bacterium]|nr:prepilin-type N-terminal cleavage/methylation domain-containing protein [Kiritimatiellota bacterium]
MKKQHFTLVEIMIVVAIIGLLAAIAIPSFIQARNTSRQNACIANLKQIDAGKEQYALAANKNDGDAVTFANLVTTYIKKTPTCPAGGAYTIGNVGTDPACNITGHTL